jgi:hypothetical protein
MEKLQWQIYTEFGVWQCARENEVVLKNADWRMLSTEKRDVRFGQHAGEWPVEKTHPAYARPIGAASWEAAERLYLHTYRELMLRVRG